VFPLLGPRQRVFPLLGPRQRVFPLLGPRQRVFPLSGAFLANERFVEGALEECAICSSNPLI
jgi:hypothetical protein